MRSTDDEFIIFTDMILRMTQEELDDWLEIERARRLLRRTRPEWLVRDADLAHGTKAVGTSEVTAGAGLFVADAHSGDQAWTVLGSYINPNSDLVTKVLRPWQPQISSIVDAGSVVYFVVRTAGERHLCVDGVLPNTTVLRDQAAWFGDHPDGAVSALLQYAFEQG